MFRKNFNTKKKTRNKLMKMIKLCYQANFFLNNFILKKKTTILDKTNTIKMSVWLKNV